MAIRQTQTEVAPGGQQRSGPASPDAAGPEAAAGPNKVVLVGNPNVGKSVLFQHLTNKYVTVSNFPGTTVEIARAHANLHGRRVEVIDTDLGLSAASGAQTREGFKQLLPSVALGEVGSCRETAATSARRSSGSCSRRATRPSAPLRNTTTPNPATALCAMSSSNAGIPSSKSSSASPRSSTH